MLASLTRILPNNSIFKWIEIEQDAFDKIKWIVACGTLSNYTDFDETFKIHTNDSAFRLGSFIRQKGKPISFYGKKLTDYQQRCKVKEK